MQAPFFQRHRLRRLLSGRSIDEHAAIPPALQLLAVFILLGAAGLAGIGHSSSTHEQDPASAIVIPDEEICESIDQCTQASAAQDLVTIAEPTAACLPVEDDTEGAAGADGLGIDDSIDADAPFAGAQDPGSVDCAGALTAGAVE